MAVGVGVLAFRMVSNWISMPLRRARALDGSEIRRLLWDGVGGWRKGREGMKCE